MCVHAFKSWGSGGSEHIGHRQPKKAETYKEDLRVVKPQIRDFKSFELNSLHDCRLSHCAKTLSMEQLQPDSQVILFVKCRAKKPASLHDYVLP